MGASVEVRLGNDTIKAELADDFLSRFMGMRFRKEGKMLFTFPFKSRPVLDMLGVPVSLQLVFLDEDRKVVDVRQAEPWGFYRPKVRSSYLLESTAPLDVEEGDQLVFEI